MIVHEHLKKSELKKEFKLAWIIHHKILHGNQGCGVGVEEWDGFSTEESKKFQQLQLRADLLLADGHFLP